MTGDPVTLTGRVAYSLSLIKELDLPVHDLDGRHLSMVGNRATSTSGDCSVDISPCRRSMVIGHKQGRLV